MHSTTWLTCKSHILISVLHITGVLVLVRMELTRRKLTSCGLLVLLILGSVDGDCDRNECQGNKECIYIQGFVPKQNPTFSAEAVIPAARLAIQDLNNSTKYLPDHELVLEFANTKVSTFFILVCVNIANAYGSVTRQKRHGS